MEIYNFPFTAILGQDDMKIALILNVIDPSIGGVLLTGQQGTGKSTAVRALVDVLPEIEVHEGCQFNCDPHDPDGFKCEICKEGKTPIVKKKVPLITLPLGATPDMVIGSINIESIIREGKKKIEPGLLARAHRGILYIDEINLLPDHLIDVLLDVSASKLNIIEREGISFAHPSNFILIGSMNPEEGELRPQISDRLGLEVVIDTVYDAQIRAEISKRAIEFMDDPKGFCKKFEPQQLELKRKIQAARENLKNIEIPVEIYEFASRLALEFGLKSQRADITLIRCARALAAFNDKKAIGHEEMERAFELVFKTRLKNVGVEMDEKFLGEKFETIWRRIRKEIDYDNDKKYDQPAHPERYNSHTFRGSKKKFDKFHETPLKNNEDNPDLPDVDGHKRDFKKQKNRYADANIDDFIKIGYKSGDSNYRRKDPFKDMMLGRWQNIEFDNRKLDIQPILSYLKRHRGITTYSGRGSRVKVYSRHTGAYSFSIPIRDSVQGGLSILDSIKAHYIHHGNNGSLQEIDFSRNIYHGYDSQKSKKKVNLVVNLNKEDLRERIYEIHAPLSIYFIVDVSASMKRTLDKIAKIIKSIHAAGYSKKDKISIISFQGRYVDILQRPSVSLTVGLDRLMKLEANSYTPLATALHKAITMIDQERIKGFTVPVIIIVSDLGANISHKNPEMNAQSNEDFFAIADELNEYARKIAKKKINVIIMKPKKSFATRFLGIHPFSVKKIEEGFAKYGAKIFEFDMFHPELVIEQLKNILK